MRGNVGSNLKSVQHGHDSYKERINGSIFVGQIVLQINFQFSSKWKILTFILQLGIKRCLKPRVHKHSEYLYELILRGDQFLEKGTLLPPCYPRTTRSMGAAALFQMNAPAPFFK